MKQTIKQIKISQIPDVIQGMDINEENIINLTIETVEEDILKVFQEIAQEAESKGLTEEILTQLLADES